MDCITQKKYQTMTSDIGAGIEISARVADTAVCDGGPDLASAPHTHVAPRDLGAVQSVEAREGPAGNDRDNDHAAIMPVYAETMPVCANGIHDDQSGVRRAGQSVNHEVSDSACSDEPRPDEVALGELNVPDVATAAGQEAPPAAASAGPSAGGASNAKARRTLQVSKHRDQKVGLS